MNLVSHLEELRFRILKSVAAILIFTLISFIFSEGLIERIIVPIGTVVFVAPQEAFVANMIVSFVCGIVIAAPIVLWQVWSFVAEGLYENEKKLVTSYGVTSLGLFFLGVLFGYFVIVPVGLRFLLGFGSLHLKPMISVGKYIGFIGLMTINFGLAFELPLVLMFLSKLGIVTPEGLRAKRKYAIVLLFIVAAVFTPPDVITQCMMAVPLMALYEVGIGLSEISKKDRN